MAKKVTPRKKAISLGAHARDKVSGFTGIVMTRYEFTTGNVQWTLQPPMKKGETEIPRSELFHHHALEYLGPGIAADVPEAIDFANLRLGERAKDRVSGLVGIVTVRAIHSSGCTSYQLQPEIGEEKKNTLPESFLFGSERLEKVDDGVIATLPGLSGASEPVEVGAPYRIPHSA